MPLQGQAMLLSDRELRDLLDEMAFETDDKRRQFKPDEQVQPCSIDLRLDRHFWVLRRPRIRRSIDLGKLSSGEIDSKRLFVARRLATGEGIRIRPGEMLLGRTFEKFTIPNGYAGKLEGRSTFARLGISVHCTGDFINPNWRGRMPLQLVNHGAVTIILTPYIRVCQLLVMRVSSASVRPYGADGLNHKYVNDEGGPSKYWLDKSLARLQESCERVRAPVSIQNRFRTFAGTDPELLDRFSAFVSELTQDRLTNDRDIMEAFADHDTRRQAWAKRRLQFYRWFPFLPITASLGALFKSPYGELHVWFWIVTALLIPLGIWGMYFAREPGQALSRADVEEYFAESA
jgi:deoxycytidine triphosphate deaminase